MLIKMEEKVKEIVEIKQRNLAEDNQKTMEVLKERYYIHFDFQWFLRKRISLFPRRQYFSHSLQIKSHILEIMQGTNVARSITPSSRKCFHHAETT